MPSPDREATVVYAIDFEAVAVQRGAASSSAPSVPTEFRVNVEIPAEVFRSDAWSAHSPGERDVRLLAIAKDFLRKHGLPSTTPGHLMITAAAQGGVLPTHQQQLNEPFQVSAPAAEEG